MSDQKHRRRISQSRKFPEVPQALRFEEGRNYHVGVEHDAGNHPMDGFFRKFDSGGVGRVPRPAPDAHVRLQ